MSADLETLNARVTEAVRAFRLLKDTTGRTSFETLLNSPGHETAKGILVHALFELQDAHAELYGWAITVPDAGGYVARHGSH